MKQISSSKTQSRARIMIKLIVVSIEVGMARLGVADLPVSALHRKVLLRVANLFPGRKAPSKIKVSRG